MKTTIDIPDEVYRKVKAKSAMEGHHVRDVAIRLFSAWVNQTDVSVSNRGKQRGSDASQTPTWFASLHKYARNAGGRYDMNSIRRSIADGRAKEKQQS